MWGGEGTVCMGRVGRTVSVRGQDIVCEGARQCARAGI